MYTYHFSDQNSDLEFETLESALEFSKTDIRVAVISFKAEDGTLIRLHKRGDGKYTTWTLIYLKIPGM